MLATGNITSPSSGTDGKYPDSAQCTWEVNAEPGFHAVYKFFDRFDVEQATGCAHDFVEIW